MAQSTSAVAFGRERQERPGSKAPVRPSTVARAHLTFRRRPAAQQVRCRSSRLPVVRHPGKDEGGEMTKQSMREEAERLVKEAMDRKAVAVKQGKTRIDARCGKCGAPNRVSADPGQVRVSYTCKECGEKQRTL